MKKSIILIIVMAVLPLKYTSAQCGNSPEFLKNLADYHKLYAHGDTSYASSAESLKVDIEGIKRAIKTLESVKTEEDYATLLPIWPFSGIEDETKIDWRFTSGDSSYWTFKHGDYTLHKEINRLYNVYLEKLSKNLFTVKALAFINDESKTISMGTTKKFEIVPKITLRKKINEYSNYEIYILVNFSYLKEMGDLSSILDDKVALRLAAEKLKKSGCPLYSELGKEIQEEVEQ